jgi:phosphoserine phosphatase
MRWPPYKHVFFDCDSTLTSVEGIDVLAESVGKGWRVGVLTKAAMDGEIDLEEIYAKRLKAVKPTRGQINTIKQYYKKNVVPDAAEVVDALQDLGHNIYIISGGLAEPVVEFGISLGIPREHIRAVKIDYDALSGNWWESRKWDSLDTHSFEERPNVAEQYLDYSQMPLTVSDGKAEIINEFMENRRGRSLLVGDGISDLLASQAVDLFIGYGGVISRERVRLDAPVHVHCLSLAPVLALAAGPAGVRRLARTHHKDLAERSLQLIEKGVITFRDEQLQRRFSAALNAAY